MPKFSSVPDMVQRLAPLAPVHCIRHHVIKTAATWFAEHFPGKILYAVKTNPDPRVLKTLYKFGIRNFDVASISEIALIRKLFPDAGMHFMHSVKSRFAIETAYKEYGIRHFALDSEDELKKIMEATGNATDLGLHVRVATPNAHSQMDLSGKFGILPTEAVSLVKKTRKVAKKLGVCFHVGSQCMHPTAYSAALLLVNDVLQQAKVKIDVLDVGGGFPSVYPGLTPPPLVSYMDEIKEEIKMIPALAGVELWCEPGRALVAESGSVVVRVDLRKGQYLYINDGTYGSLFDAGQPGFIFPTRLIRPGKDVDSEPMLPFSFYGPTCDSMDAMRGPFYLPASTNEGDWIEIGQLGAYGTTLRTKFNGFYSDTVVDVADEPLMSVFGLTKKNIEFEELYAAA